MGSNTSATATTTPAARLEPKQPLLGELKFGPEVAEPLGGINPYNPHFDRIGIQFRQLCIEHAGLQKKHHILEIGCGTGRIANSLREFIDGGSYHGFDPNARYINHCKESKYGPQFNFEHHDIQHDEYNLNGTINATTFEFPYKNRSFDIVVAVAVFNHFRTPWIFQYMRQISRVLKPRGVLLATMFLLNRQSMEYINTRTRQPYSFTHRTPESWHDFESRPLFNVAHPEEAVRRVCIKSGLIIKEPIRYGEWCLSKIALAGPDVLLCRKGGWGQ
jgi:SAM-dependent methyltransferase